MFERFNDQARRLVVLAQEEARIGHHDYIGTEHLLLGLTRDSGEPAARALESLGLRYDTVREQVDQIIGQGHGMKSGHMPLTPNAKKALQLALREAMHLGDGCIGEEHILLALIREGQGPAMEVMKRLGADPAQVRERVLELRRDARPGDQAGAVTERAAGAVIWRAPKAGRGKRKLMAELIARFEAVESRLSALERRVGAVPDLRYIDEQVAPVREQKEAAIDAQDYEQAAVLRDREKQLLTERAACQQEWLAAQSHRPSLTDEVERLRDVLREHGIEPRDGAA